MGWREVLLERLGPGLLGGVTLMQWLRLVAAHGAAISPALLPRAASITFNSVSNSVASAVEGAIYGRRIAATEIPPPVFIVGHWRHGTTHLHNLLAVDDRFAWPTTYEACFPAAFLVTERLHAPIVDFFLPRTRPMDNIAWSMASPQEDEFAPCILTGCSTYMAWIFPGDAARYDKFLTLREASADEVRRWREMLLWFLRKLTFKYRRPLILKSPPHTARVRLLLEMFPDARFLHIRRDPFATFISTRRMVEANVPCHRLQRLTIERLDDRILATYAAMYDAYGEERRLIPPGRLAELNYEDLERDPIGEVRRLYEQLALPDFEQVEPALRQYVGTLTNYQKNVHPRIDESLRKRIADAWSKYYEPWGYVA